MNDAVAFNTGHRQKVREWELERVLENFPPGARILEIGAGAGWQAKRLAERGFQVSAIDIAETRYKEFQVFDVQTYDGVHIPLADHSVDVVFSSNVLEHVPGIEAFQQEMKRVLAPNGVAVHVMPTTSWRFWTTLSFYMKRLKDAFGKLQGSSAAPAAAKEEHHDEAHDTQPRKKGFAAKLRRALFPTLHGIRGNVLSEHFYFSEGYWRPCFEQNGWKLQKVYGTGLFYTGYRVLGARLPLGMRKALAGCLGNSCKVYIARPVEGGES